MSYKQKSHFHTKNKIIRALIFSTRNYTYSSRFHMQHLKSQTKTSHSDLESHPLSQPWAGFGLGSGNTDTHRCCSEGLGGCGGRSLVDKPWGLASPHPPLLSEDLPTIPGLRPITGKQAAPSLHGCPPLPSAEVPVLRSPVVWPGP